jgi:hypothetical protein
MKRILASFAEESKEPVTTEALAAFVTGLMEASEIEAQKGA